MMMKDELVEKVEILGPHLPTNALDELIEGLGGTEHVAEMTGRRGRIIFKSNGKIMYEVRTEDDATAVNVKERQRFMDGEKVRMVDGWVRYIMSCFFLLEI